MSGVRLLDIEGTVLPVAFVHEVLFPYARQRLGAWLAAHAAEPEVAAALAEVPGEDRLATLLQWMDEDRKVAPLKTLQGLVWRDGFAAGALVAPLYGDVVPAFDRWQAAGDRLAVFSSGSVEAQRQVFGHTPAGDLVPRFSGFFDTRTGAKRAPEAYGRIAAALGVPPGAVTFYSDVVEELDAARAAGVATVWVVRDGPLPADVRHPVVRDLTP